MRPAIALLDLDMPKMDGFAVTKEAQYRRIPVHIAFLTMHAKADLFHAAIDLGVRGYILKDSAVLEVVQGLLAIAGGHLYVSAALTSQLLGHGRMLNTAARVDSTDNGLTRVERRILRMIADYKSSKEIADALCIHYRTVENRRSLICQKLGLHGNNALLKYAIAHKADI